MVSNNTGNMYRCSMFRNSGRKAGYGVMHDDYSEASGNPDYEKHERVRLPNDHTNPESLNGEVIIVQKGRKKDGNL